MERVSLHFFMISRQQEGDLINYPELFRNLLVMKLGVNYIVENLGNLVNHNITPFVPSAQQAIAGLNLAIKSCFEPLFTHVFNGRPNEIY